ncbi:MAG: zinc-binding alcohol dehydrogenase [Planctomycetota bacterium]
MSTRRIVKLDDRGQLQVVEEPTPKLQPYTILVEVKSCLLSPGTELEGIISRRKKPSDSGKMYPIGYANAGVVTDVGEGCKGVKKGMRVACIGGGDASHASHVLMPINLTTPMPDGQSFDEAAFAHLAATALNAVRRSEIQFGQNVLVVGLGLVGQIASQIAKVCGTHVMVSDRLPIRLEKAREFGVDLAIDPTKEKLVEKAKAFTRGYGLDVAIIAFGGDATELMKEIVTSMKLAPDGHNMGVITIVGGAQFTGLFPVPFGNIDVRASSRPGPGYHDKEWERGRDYPPVFVEWNTRRNMEECLRFAAEGALKLEPLITHRLPLEKAAQGYQELIDNPNKTLGVILNP